MHPKGEKFAGKWGGIDTVMAGMLLVNWLANSNLFVTKKERETGREIERGAFIIVLRGGKLSQNSGKMANDKRFSRLGQYEIGAWFNET